MLTLDDKNDDKNPKVTVVDWTPSGEAILVQYGEADRWDRGISRLDLKTKILTTLVRDSNLYQGFRLSRDGSTVIFQKSDGTRPAEALCRGCGVHERAEVDRPESLDREEGVADIRAGVISRRRRKVLYGVLRYPIGYEKGRRYPTVFELYETFFDNGFNGRAAMLASQGYAVFHPSVNLVVVLPWRVVGEGRNRRGQPVDRHGCGRSH